MSKKEISNLRSIRASVEFSIPIRDLKRDKITILDLIEGSSAKKLGVVEIRRPAVDVLSPYAHIEGLAPSDECAAGPGCKPIDRRAMS